MFFSIRFSIILALLAPTVTAFHTTAPRIENVKSSSVLFSTGPPGIPGPPGPPPQGTPPPGTPPSGARNDPMMLWELSAGKEQLIQGDSLKTWSYPSPQVEQVQVSMKTDGRPLNAKIDLWHGPDYVATSTKVYTEDGFLRPYNGVQATPKGMNTVGLYNTGNAEFPYSSMIEADPSKANLIPFAQDLAETGGPGTLIQGGAIQSFPFPANVESVAIMMNTDGRNLKCHLELLQGPNNNKQEVEYYASDGYKRPFFTVINSPGSGNVVRITNQNTVEFPLTAWVVPHVINNEFSPYDPVVGGAR